MRAKSSTASWPGSVVLPTRRRRRRTSSAELCTELAIVAAFLAATGAIALWLPAAGFSPITALVLGALLVVMLAVEFDVAEGRSSPVQLVQLPMLVLLPPAFVPLVVAGAHIARAGGTAVRGGRPPLTIGLAAATRGTRSARRSSSGCSTRARSRGPTPRSSPPRSPARSRSTSP